tara:strand:+ start:1547 stop:1669 length:123 start_codon:yes stop_codon:yes gene_type:complete
MQKSKTQQFAKFYLKDLKNKKVKFENQKTNFAELDFLSAD